MSPTAPANVQVLVVMGVAGSGKSTVGAALAAAFGWRFVDGDDHHSPANIAKMARGEPLDDADRWPWLDELRGIIAAALEQRSGLVLACSALKARYRERLTGGGDGRVRFVHLTGTPELLRARLARRAGHFMKPGMLDSQLAALEPPADAIEVDAGLPVEAIVARVRGVLGP
jgi:gluconokinase